MCTVAVGSGRKHGERPSEEGPELALYLMTHGANAARVVDSPDVVNDVAELINWYRTLPGCGTGGSLHIAVEDENLEDRHLSWCEGFASAAGDTCGAELAGLLERMSVYDRVHAVDLANERRA